MVTVVIKSRYKRIKIGKECKEVYIKLIPNTNTATLILNDGEYDDEYTIHSDDEVTINYDEIIGHGLQYDVYLDSKTGIRYKKNYER